MLRQNQLDQERQKLVRSAGEGHEQPRWWVDSEPSHNKLLQNRISVKARGDVAEKAEQTLFEPRGKAQKRLLWTELLSCKFKDSMSLYIQQMKGIKERLASESIAVEEDLIVAALMRGLPKEYEACKTRVLTSSSSLEDVFNLLLEVEQSKLEMKQKLDGQSEKKVKVRCYDCGRRGHRSGDAKCPRYLSKHMHIYVHNLVRKFENV